MMIHLQDILCLARDIARQEELLKVNHLALSALINKCDFLSFDARYELEFHTGGATTEAAITLLESLMDRVD